MKQVNCEIIKDLLPSYIDNVSSKSTNDLVEEHIKDCKGCQTKLKEMNKEVDIKPLYKQEEQIDYLKGYRKNKIMTIIFTIILTIDIIGVGLLAYQLVVNYVNIFADVNDIEVLQQKQIYNWEGEEYINFDITPKKCKVMFNECKEIDDKGNIIIYLNIVGKLDKPCGTAYSINSKGISKIYLRDLKGNVKEIWNNT